MVESDEIKLPPHENQPWYDLPEKYPAPLPPLDIRREGLWIIEDFDIVWEAPLPGLIQ